MISSSTVMIMPPWAAPPPPMKYEPNVRVALIRSGLDASTWTGGSAACPREGSVGIRPESRRASGCASGVSASVQRSRSVVSASSVAASGAASTKAS
ncbi:hypothetical protein [Aeromicrobium sp. UC242_57]|uniref:hypothetical protein n=1 Tax=Aeromicrobium sp. UC242_57 TaxID=3374624 RepID=UPI0037BFBFB8